MHAAFQPEPEPVSPLVSGRKGILRWWATCGVVSLFSMAGVVALGVVDITNASSFAGAQPTVRDVERHHDGAAVAGRSVRLVQLREREATRDVSVQSRDDAAPLREDGARVASGLITAGSYAIVPTPFVTADLAEAVARLRSSEDPIDRALASIASVRRPYTDATWTQTDALLAQAEEKRASGTDWRDDSEYRYQLVMGDRHRFDDDPDGAAPFYEAALALRPGDAEATIRLVRVLAGSRAADRDHRLRRGLALLDGLLEQGDILDRVVLATLCSDRAFILWLLERNVEALSAINRALEISLRHFHPEHAAHARDIGEPPNARDPEQPRSDALIHLDRAYPQAFASLHPLHPIFATQFFIRACILSALGYESQALEAIDRVIRIDLLNFPPDHPVLAARHMIRAESLRGLDRTDEALQAIDLAREIGRRHLPPAHPHLATIEANLTYILHELKRFGEALEAVDRFMEIAHRSERLDHELVKEMIWLRLRMLRELNRFDEALEAAARTIEHELRKEQPAYLIVADLHRYRADWLEDFERYDEALEAIDGAIASERMLHPVDQPAIAAAFWHRMCLLRSLERFDEALEAIDRAIEIERELLEPDDLTLALRHWERSDVLSLLERFDEALAALDLAIAIEQKHHPHGCTSLAKMYSSRGNHLRQLRRFSEALEAKDRAVEIWDRDAHTLDRALADRYYAMAMAYFDGQLSNAIERLEDLIQRRISAYGPDDEELDELRQFLDRFRAELAQQQTDDDE